MKKPAFEAFLLAVTAFAEESEKSAAPDGVTAMIWILCISAFAALAALIVIISGRKK